MLSPSSSPSSRQLGRLLRDYPGSGDRLIWTVIWAAVSILGLIASLFSFSFGGFMFWLVVGAGCYAYYYYVQRDVNAQLYEHGFAISRGGRTTTGRWEDIAKVEHWIKRQYMFAVITTSKSHTYIIYLTSGQKVKVTDAFKNETELGETIQSRWLNTVAASRAKTNND